jgi:cytochrome bd ubiquinol oxidase subunit I
MNVDLARIQFAFTSINHFFFVPVTMGLAFLTALLQTAWYRTKIDAYLRLTRSCTASGLWPRPTG